MFNALVKRATRNVSNLVIARVSISFGMLLAIHSFVRLAAAFYQADPNPWAFSTSTCFFLVGLGMSGIARAVQRLENRYQETKKLE